MSEKRFYYEFGNDGYYIIDKEKIEEYDESFTDKMEYREYTIENSLSGDEVVDLLNNLHQENQILETYCKVQNESKEYWRNKAKRLEEENEQLRKENFAMKDEQNEMIAHLRKENEKIIENKCTDCELVSLQTRKIDTLTNENEQLKEENNMLKITIDRNDSYIRRLTHQSDWHC